MGRSRHHRFWTCGLGAVAGFRLPAADLACSPCPCRENGTSSHSSCRAVAPCCSRSLSADKPPRVAVYLLGSGETRPLFEGVGARFVRSGHVVFGLQGRLWAVGFDPTSLKTVGTARPVRDDVLWSPAGYPQFAVGGSTLAYVRASQKSSEVGRVALAWMDRHGRRDTIPLEPNNFLLYRLSPTGNRMVVQVGASQDLWTYDFTRGNFYRLTSDRIIAYSAPDMDPGREPRGVHHLVRWRRGARYGASGWERPGRGTHQGHGHALVRDGPNPVMLPDGSGVILSGVAPGATAEDLLFVSLTGERRVETLFQAGGVERNPAIAPNGRFIAYNSDESSRIDVYVRPFPNAGSRQWQISTEGGRGPVWTRGGSEIVYVDGQGRMMAVAVRSDQRRVRVFKAGAAVRSRPDHRQWPGSGLGCHCGRRALSHARDREHRERSDDGRGNDRHPELDRGAETPGCARAPIARGPPTQCDRCRFRKRTRRPPTHTCVASTAKACGALTGVRLPRSAVVSLSRP